jgi:hypothetical protein
LVGLRAASGKVFAAAVMLEWRLNARHPAGRPAGPFSIQGRPSMMALPRKTEALQNLEAIRGVILGSAAPCLWAETFRRVVAE